MAEKWYFNHVNPDTGLLEHVYYPTNDDYGDLDDHTGSMGSARALLQAQKLQEIKKHII